MQVVDPAFISFLRATLSQMAGTGVIDKAYIDFDFWAAWPRRFYNVRSYDITKEDFEKGDPIEIDANDLSYDNITANIHVPPSRPPPPQPKKVIFFCLKNTLMFFFKWRLRE